MSKPRILHSGSYWQDVHRRRRESRQRLEHFQNAAVHSPGDFLLPGAQLHGVAYTFTPQRSAPYVTFVQNDGRLLTFPTGPVDLVPPPPPPKPRPVAISAARARAQALLDARPSPDEELLARLAAGRSGLKRKASLEVVTTAAKRCLEVQGPARKQTHSPCARAEAAERRAQEVDFLIGEPFTPDPSNTIQEMQRMLAAIRDNIRREHQPRTAVAWWRLWYQLHNYRVSVHNYRVFLMSLGAPMVQNNW
ncbi:hypothetical protein B0H13DRAFT_1869764 [Mycena leptocephala]|nr:hypothetical protein B0H13DRAFT_1869764 [Mycena leptocephala]